MLLTHLSDAGSLLRVQPSYIALELYQKIDDFVRLLRGEIAGEVCEGRMLHVYQGAVVLGCQWHQFFG